MSEQAPRPIENLIQLIRSGDDDSDCWMTPDEMKLLKIYFSENDHAIIQNPIPERKPVVSLFSSIVSSVLGLIQPVRKK